MAPRPIIEISVMLNSHRINPRHVRRGFDVLKRLNAYKQAILISIALDIQSNSAARFV
jgi:hypothetical protein